ncbi:MAG: NAD-binding protein [Myxococcales bacterium]|nr:NAD-binding protein [Myxococcales bacterium]
MTRSRAAWTFRVGLLLVTFVAAMVAFRSGVGVSASGESAADLLTHTYWALSLFVLGGTDIGLPTGGPAGMRALLWAVYFLAPAITTSAVVESALRVLRPDWLRRFALRDHVVVVGLGHLGTTFLEALREREPHRRVLVIEKDAAGAAVTASRFQAALLAADVRDEGTLDAMHLDRARAVVLLTGDDLINLEVGSRITRIAPHVRVVAHVSDIATRRLVERSGAGARIQTFNSHRIAAHGLHEDHLEAAFAATEPRDIVVIAGFGRFGQTTLEHLLVQARGEMERAIVVDVAAERRVRAFHAQVAGTEGCAIVTVEGDLDDPLTWSQVDRALESYEVEPLFVLATDDDGRNLRAASALRDAGKTGPIYVRCVYRSTFSAELSEERDFVVLSIDEVLRRTMRERMAEWVG